MGKFSYQKQIQPNNFQQELIFGSLLGDMGIYKRKNYANYNINMSHSVKQEDYFLWKFNKLQPYFNKYRYYTRKSGHVEIVADSLTLPFLHTYGYLFYENKIKIIPKNLSDFLTPLSLAIWYMDDGHTKKQDGLASLATMCFTETEHNIMMKSLKDNFDIDSYIKFENRKNGKTYLSLRFNRKNSIKLFKVIDEFVIDSMRYKLKY